MAQNKICLASDNWTAAHPQILKAVVEANKGYAPAYGDDRWTLEAQKLLQKTFKAPSCQVHIVPTGTGSNVLGLALACRRHESVVCTDIAHITSQETGAAEALVGCKLLSVPHQKGKITPHDLLQKCTQEKAIGKHSTHPRLLSVSQSTEFGTVYTLEELHALSQICRREGLFFHMDGNRLYNAAVHLKASLHEIVEAGKIDLLSLGGTKNGLLSAESLLIFNKDLQIGNDHLQKQTLQLMSKMRYASCQYIPFLKNQLWKTLTTKANQQAAKIASVIQNTHSLSLSYPVETNQIFFTCPTRYIPLIQKEIECHVWNQEKNEIRFVTSWNTSDQEIKRVNSVFNNFS